LFRTPHTFTAEVKTRQIRFLATANAQSQACAPSSEMMVTTDQPSTGRSDGMPSMLQSTSVGIKLAWNSNKASAACKDRTLTPGGASARTHATSGNLGVVISLQCNERARKTLPSRSAKGGQKQRCTWSNNRTQQRKQQGMRRRCWRDR
jgi:hypothetical protein